MSSRTCPDWPKLMEYAPELQFKHYTVAEARLPAEALMNIPDVPLGAARGEFLGGALLGLRVLVGDPQALQGVTQGIAHPGYGLG